MSVQLKSCLLFVWLVVSLLNFSSPADLAPSTGYSSTHLFDNFGTFVPIEGLDLDGDDVLLGFGTNVWSFNIETQDTNVVGTLPANVSVAFVQHRGATVHAAYGENFSFPAPSRHGVMDGLGGFSDLGGLAGIYDAAVDSSNTLYVVANPGFTDTAIYRFDEGATQLVQVAYIGGFSGGIAFDSQDRLYVAEQAVGNILRFTPAQLASGGLTADDGEIIAPVTAKYICFDEHDRLYALPNFGNLIVQIDVATGAQLRTIAVDDLGGYGIGRIRWDSERKQLLVLYGVYLGPGSALSALRFTDSHEGVDGASTTFQGWIAAVRSVTRPNTNSGGYARNDANQPVSASEAVSGKPLEFSTGIEASGHVLSLGNGGSVVLEFADVITDRPGADFAVFENGFYYGDGTFVEFAFVEVATTTNAWAKFPVTYYNTNSVGQFGLQDVTMVDGLAGKHEVEFGTPFDLSWLQADTNVLNGSVDLENIAYIRLTDVVGDGSTVDQFGQPIYDPYDGGYFSSTDGFDLRGVGVFHHAGIEMSAAPGGLVMSWFGYPGRVYQPTKSLDGTSWLDHGAEIVGTGGVHHVTLTGSDAFAMYRLDQEVVAGP